MKEMIQKVREERGGFTLAELLIVVAIVLVLVAIAIPVFTGALDNANKAVQQADIRSVKAAAVTKVLLESDAKDLKSGEWTATANVDKNGNVGEITVTKGAGTDSAEDDGNGGYNVTVGIKASDVK